MTTQVQFRRGTTSQHSSFTGAVGEVTVDTDLSTLKVHDGSAAGGVRIAKFTDIASAITAATIDISDSSSNTVSLVPGASDITFIGDDITIAATGNTMTFTLNNSISLTTLTVNEISSADSTAVQINDILNVNEIASTDSTAIQIADGLNVSGAITTASTITAGGVVTAAGFTIGSAVIDETDLEKIDGITNGAGAANKALVLDGSANVASGLAALTASGVVTAAGFTIGSAVIDETDLEKLDGITNGTAAANKALVADANIDIGTIRNLSMTGNMDVGGDLQLDGNLTVSGTTNSVNTTTLEVADALLELNKNNSGGSDIDGGILIQRGSAGNNAAFYWNEGDDAFKAVLTNSAGTATAVTDSSFAELQVGTLTIGSASIVEAELETIDGVTAGTVAASKAVVVDANKDITTFRNCTATTFIGALTGNATTATTLATARNIGGVSFNGSGNIDLPGVNTAGNQNTTGNAATVSTQSRAVDAAHFLTFVTDNNGSATAESLFTDAGIAYNPNGNVLTTTVTAAQYSDLAEKYVADAQYEPGTVVIFGGDHEVTTTEVSHDSRVAGVISTAPGFIMNESCEGTHVVELALTGRVPCKVKGVVAKGDMIVSSNVAGVGTKLNSASYQIGCIIGKALESKDTAEEGVIEVVVGRL